MTKKVPPLVNPDVEAQTPIESESNSNSNSNSNTDRSAAASTTQDSVATATAIAKGQASPDTTVARVLVAMPLNAKWTMWFDHPRLSPAGSDWKENLKPCGSFDTVESFWRIYNNLKPASELTANSNYSVFRHGVEPSWEDPANSAGGKFVFTMVKKNAKSKCDECWLFTVLAIIGETMDATGDQVNGAVVSIRKQQDRIALWLKSSDRDVCVQIGERWKKVLWLDKGAIRYQTHSDAASSGRSFRNEVHFEV